MGALLQNPFVLVFIAAVLVSLATSLFGFWELKLPYGLTQAASKTYSGYFGSIFMGLSMGIVAAPCIGPFVLGLLTWVASMGSPWLGFVIFFTLSLGLGMPLFFLALFSGQMNKLPRSGMWMLWVRKLMAWILIGMAVYFIQPILPQTAGVVEQASRNFVMVKIDLTRKGEPVHEQLLTQYQIKGVPTVIFLDRHGKERADLRAVDFLPPDQEAALNQFSTAADYAQSLKTSEGLMNPEGIKGGVSGMCKAVYGGIRSQRIS